MSGHQTHLPPHAHRDTCSYCIKGNWVWRRMSQERSCSSLWSIEAFDFVNNAFKWQNCGESQFCGCEIFRKQWHLWALMCVSVGTHVLWSTRGGQKTTSCVGPPRLSYFVQGLLVHSCTDQARWPSGSWGFHASVSHLLSVTNPCYCDHLRRGF